MADEKSQLDRLIRRYEREAAARREAEAIAERVTRDLYAATHELQEANQAIRDFVAVASHDLKGPLTSILGSAALIRQQWGRLDDDKKQEFLGVIERQAALLGRMVDDLLTLSKIEAGAMEPHAQAVELRTAIDRAIDDFAQYSQDIAIRVPEDVAVLVDPDHLHRIIANYVGNALKYGAPPIEVAVRCMDGWVELLVSDNGEGVPEDFIPRLFGKFARADTEATRKQRGTGLGLSIVKGLAQVNGGDTWYEPHEPHGSCFAVRLQKGA